MPRTPSTRKPGTKSTTRTAKTTVKRRTTKKTAEEEISPIAPHLSETTREQLRKLGDKLSEATDKGVHVAKEVVERVRSFTSDATEVTKLKIEIHRLKSLRDKLFTEMGEKLGEVYKSRTLSEVQSIFSDDFARLEDLEKQIAEKEHEAAQISL